MGINFPFSAVDPRDFSHVHIIPVSGTINGRRMIIGRDYLFHTRAGATSAPRRINSGHRSELAFWLRVKSNFQKMAPLREQRELELVRSAIRQLIAGNLMSLVIATTWVRL